MAGPNYLSRYLGENGALKRALPGFMPRPQQQTVAAAIESAMAAPGGIALIEAGTGVGKTLAYLLPPNYDLRLDKPSPRRPILVLLLMNALLAFVHLFR